MTTSNREQVEDIDRELRLRLDYRRREIIEASGIDPAVAHERGYRLEKTKRGLERLGFNAPNKTGRWVRCSHG